MKKIVVFIGVIGSGKDYNSNLWLKQNEGSKKLAFSEGVREFTFNILKWNPKDEYEYEWFKDSYVINFPFQRKGREMLESVADQMRRYDSEFWGKYWFQKAKRELATTDMLIVPDCRHEEEAQKILTLSAHLGIQPEFYFCDYKSERYEIRDHSSEKFAQKILAQGAKDGQFINEIVRELTRIKSSK